MYIQSVFADPEDPDPKGQCVGGGGAALNAHPYELRGRSVLSLQLEITTNLAAILLEINMASSTTALLGGGGGALRGFPERSATKWASK